MRARAIWAHKEFEYAAFLTLRNSRKAEDESEFTTEIEQAVSFKLEVNVKARHNLRSVTNLNFDCF
jgi:hypothetical protein